jgi:hypothetical protein
MRDFDVESCGYVLVGCRHCFEQFEVMRATNFPRVYVVAHGARVGACNIEHLARAVPLTCPQSPANASGDE